MCVSGCTPSETINHNIKQDADHFRTYRQISVINLRTDTMLMQVEGYMSISNSADNELAVTIKINKDSYQMHYIYVGSEVCYLVEQLEDTHTDAYHWEIRVYIPVPIID